MEVLSLDLPGVQLLISSHIGDKRGYFAETFRADRSLSTSAISSSFKAMNRAASARIPSAACISRASRMPQASLCGAPPGTVRCRRGYPPRVAHLWPVGGRDADPRRSTTENCSLVSPSCRGSTVTPVHSATPHDRHCCFPYSSAARVHSRWGAGG